MYLVTGGQKDGFDRLSSTEVLVDGTTAWMSAGELPVAMYSLRGVSLNNDVFVTGNIIIQHMSFITIMILQEDGMEVVSKTTFTIQS